HDRALPRGKANLDHLVIGPVGLVVVDSKNWARGRMVKGRGRGVRVGRVSGARVVGSTLYELDAVAGTVERVLGRPVPGAAVLAILGANLRVWRAVVVNGVPFLPARKVRRWITRQPTQLSHADVTELARVCAQAFPPYTA